MLSKIYALYRARKDSTLAARLARELVVEGALERASWPLAIAKFWMGLIGLGLTVLAALSLWGALALHRSFAIFAVPFVGLIYVIVRVWRGLEAGKETVLELAQLQTEAGVIAVRTRLSNRTPKAPQTDNAT